jgi:Protein of unknown function (DUF2735)
MSPRRNGIRREMMNTSFDHGSAKIYQFPAGGRAAVGARYDETKNATDLAASRVSEAAVGGAWYHEAAIHEAEIQESKPVRES